MADWLRPVFARTRTPVPSALTADRPSSTIGESIEDEAEQAPRLKPSSRVSSYIGLRPSTPIFQAPDMFFNVRNPESVYKPSRDQIAEMVKVVMMNQDTISPIPVQFNSAILHVLEAYQELREELNKKEAAIEELKQSHAKDIKDFEALAKQWEYKEKDYKTELKNLEVLLSRTEGGMEKVTLARTKSTIHGSVRASESIASMISTIKERNAARHSRNRGQSDTTIHSASSEKLLAPRINVPRNRRPRLSQPPISQKSLETSFNNRVLRTQSSDETFPTYISPLEATDHSQCQLLQDLPNLTRIQLEALERQQEQRGIDNSPSSDNKSPSDPSEQQAKGLGLEFMAKPLPVLHTDVTTNKSRNIGFMHTGYDHRPTPSQMSFSFNPGDDIDLEILARKATRDRTQKVLEEHLRQRLSANSSQKQSPTSPVLSEPVSRPKSAILTPKSRPTTSLTPPEAQKDLREYDPLGRNGSNSSVVTAVRHNSGRSSTTGSQRHSQRGRTGLNSSSGSSEAITAAVRAIAGSSASKIPRRSLSSSQEESRKNSPRHGSESANAESRHGSEDVRDGKLKKKGTLATSESASLTETQAKKGAKDP